VVVDHAPCQGRSCHLPALFAGSDGGARHWALVASLVATAKLNGVEPLAWLTDVLERMVSGRTKAHELEQLLPWKWQAERVGTEPKVTA
jgi:transposase